jgi:ERCC4-type nuclease
LIDDEVLIERKTIADFAASLGPALASRLLRQFGSIRSVVTADIDTLQQVRGVGPKRATRIVELLG